MQVHPDNYVQLKLVILKHLPILGVLRPALLSRIAMAFADRALPPAFPASSLRLGQAVPGRGHSRVVRLLRQ